MRINSRVVPSEFTTTSEFTRLTTPNSKLTTLNYLDFSAVIHQHPIEAHLDKIMPLNYKLYLPSNKVVRKSEALGYKGLAFINPEKKHVVITSGANLPKIDQNFDAL